MILLYHAIIPDDSPLERMCVGQALPQAAFEQHIRWLVDHYRIVSMPEYLEGWKPSSTRRDRKIALTFDDGFALMFRCIFPFLVEMNIPTTIFISTGHLGHGKLLWFNYLKALCFENLYEVIEINRHVFHFRTLEQRKDAWNGLRKVASSNGSPVIFCNELAKTYPLTPEVAALYGGMTHEQIKLAADSGIVEIGSHTVTHPYLDQMRRADQEIEIDTSRRLLSELSGMPIRYFAYPGGDYSCDTLDVVWAMGFEASFAVIPKKIGTEPRFEIGRVGIYSQSLLKLQLKTLGMADWARRFGWRVG